MPTPPTVRFDQPPEAGGIWAFIQALPNTLGSIAPERVAALNELLDSLVVHFTNEDTFKACKLFASKTIVISRGFVEAIWLATWCQLVTEEILAAQAAAKQPLVLDQADPRVKQVFEALHRIVALAVDDTPIDWSGIPSPVPASPVHLDSSMEAKVGEFALTALAFVLHHELAHATLGHGPGDTEWTLAQEKDADGHAIEWILDGATTQPKIAAKRAFGMVTVLVVLTAKRLREAEKRARTAPWNHQDHPYPHDRLQRALSHQAVAADPQVNDTLTRWTALFILPVLLTFGVPVGMEPVNTFADLVARCFDALAAFLVADPKEG